VITEPPLFADKVRTDNRRGRATESDHDFLDRVSGQYFENMRVLLNEWFERFGRTQHNAAVRDIRSRLRAKQTGQFFAAFWELYLHELFARLGFEIEVHPESERGKRPDFAMNRGDDRLYLEAVMPTPPTGERNQGPDLATVIEFIDEAYHPAWRLSLRHVIAGKQTPRKVAVRDVVVGWLDTFDADQWLQRNGRPETKLRVDDWQITLAAFPLAPGDRLRAHKRMIWIGPGGAGYPEALGVPIKKTLSAKANKYGDLEAPLIIAMWVMNMMADEDTAPLALFGSPLGELGPGVEPTGLDSTVQRTEGLWTPYAKNRGRASAVLAATSFTFGFPAVARTLPHLWTNPHADHSLTTDFPFGASRVSEDEKTIQTVPATDTAAALLGLPENWPGERERLA
jgi:hypothetical protein